jgi:hypothetical protein
MIAGYGTSPDDRVTIGQLERVSLTSYRIGAGYFKSFNNHYLTGIQTTNQRIRTEQKQNEFEISLSFKF